MSEQRTPPQTPDQPADAAPSPTETSDKRERDPTTDRGRKENEEEERGLDRGRKENEEEERGLGADKVALVEGRRRVRKTIDRANNGGEAENPAAKESKKTPRVRGGRGQVEGSKKPVGVGGGGGGATEGNGQGREADVVKQDVVPDPPKVADAPPADTPPAVAPTANTRPADTPPAVPPQDNNRGQAVTEEMLALRAQLAALQEIQAALEAQRDQERQAKEQAQRESQERDQELRNIMADLQHANNQRGEVWQTLQQSQEVAGQRDQELRDARAQLAAAERRQSEAEQRVAAQLEAARQAQAAAEQLMQQAQSEAEQRVAAAAEAARAETTRAMRAAHGQLVAAERRAEQAERQNQDLENQRDAALLELNEARRSPAPNAEGGVVPGGGEEDEDGGGEELPRMASPGAAYVAEVAEGQIPNDIGPLARVIETDPRWRPGRREDFEDTPNIESIERRRYNRSAGNVLYETNFPIGQFASVRVPMPRGTPQTLALFGRNAHVATPAQSINRAIMRYEGRGVYR